MNALLALSIVAVVVAYTLKVTPSDKAHPWPAMIVKFLVAWTATWFFLSQLTKWVKAVC